MRVDPVSLYPERGSRGALLGHVKNSVQLILSGREVHHKDGDLVDPIENAAGRFDERGEPTEINGRLNERPTRRQSHSGHRQSRFQIRTFLSKAGAGRTIVYSPGKQILFEQGKRGNAVFYILTGTVKLSVVFHGKETTIGLLGPGNFAGKECIATARPWRTASARALTNCTIVRIERKEILRVIQQEKTFAAFFLDYLLACMSRYQEVIVDQLSNSSEKAAGPSSPQACYLRQPRLARAGRPTNPSGRVGGAGWRNPIPNQFFHESLPKIGLHCLQGARLHHHPYSQVVEICIGLTYHEDPDSSKNAKK
jgi:CRP-like cAMP-binding protein